MYRLQRKSSIHESNVRMPLIEACESRRLFTYVGNHLDVIAGSAPDSGTELFVRDAETHANPRLLLDIVSGPISSDPTNFNAIINENGGITVYFSAKNGDGNREVWRTNGTTGGTQRIATAAQLVSALARPPSDPAAIYGVLLYGNGNPASNVNLVLPNGRRIVNIGTGIYGTDGTADGTTFLGFGNAAFTSGANVWVIGDNSVWHTDGTTAGTSGVRRYTTPAGTWVYNSASRRSDGSIVVSMRRVMLPSVNGGNVIQDVFSFMPVVSPSDPAPITPPADDAKPVYLWGVTLRIFGTSGADRIEISRSPSNPNRLVVIFNGARSTFDAGRVPGMTIFGGPGNDIIRIKENYGAISANTYIAGEAGNDTISGASGSDTLMGGDGNDVLIGGAGRDRIDGGAGTDKLFGGEGKDWFASAETIELRDKAKADLLII